MGGVNECDCSNNDNDPHFGEMLQLIISRRVENATGVFNPLDSWVEHTVGAYITCIRI